MRLSKSRWKLLAAVTAPLAAAVLLTGVLPASASAPQAAARGMKASEASRCIQLNLIELTETIYSNVAPSSDVPVGTMAIYFDNLYDSSGTTLLGHSDGHIDIMYRNFAGHDIESVAETMQFPDGTLLFTGTLDRTVLLAQEPVTSAVQGTSGRYLGMHGSIVWRIVSLAPPNYPVSEQITMCR
jgi:hypothetical protein